MPAPLTIIIPTYNAAAALPATFACLVEGLQAGIIARVIVVDGGSTDDTVDVADAWGADVISAPPSRGGQLRVGAAAATTDLLLFLHADTHLPAGWTGALDGVDPTRAYCFRLGFRAQGVAPHIVAGWANLRTRLFGLPYGDQGLLIHRDLYHGIGGYDNIPLMEDVAIVRKLPDRPIMLPMVAMTDAHKYQRQGWIRRGARNISLLIRYLLGESPESVAKKY